MKFEVAPESIINLIVSPINTGTGVVLGGGSTPSLVAERHTGYGLVVSRAVSRRCPEKYDTVAIIVSPSRCPLVSLGNLVRLLLPICEACFALGLLRNNLPVSAACGKKFPKLGVGVHGNFNQRLDLVRISLNLRIINLRMPDLASS